MAIRRRASAGRWRSAPGGGSLRRAWGCRRTRPFPGAGMARFYPWPPHNQPLLDEAFAELARRWRPLLDLFDEQGVDVCYRIHPGEDLHDGVTFERFLARVDNHPRCNMLYDPSHLRCADGLLGPISISIMRVLKRFTSRTPNFAATGAMASTVDTSPAAGRAFSLSRRRDRLQRGVQ